MPQEIKIGIRPSLLAFKQAEEIRRRLSDISVTVVPIETSGDKDKATPLKSVENTSFFTDGIEQALCDGSIDAAVHSAKDLEEDVPADLIIAAMTMSISPHDCLVSRNGMTLDTLEKGSIIGTSSLARKKGIERYRRDLVVKDIRGNVDDRLRQVDSGDFDAVIVAHAALIRLYLLHRMSQLISPKIIQPHPLQGRLAIQIRKDREDLRKTFEGFDGN